MISVIVPVYLVNNDLVDMTYECLEGLYRTDGIDEVIVVDDGSPIKIDGTWFTVVERPENGGYASAVNSGLAKAKGDVIIISNNDIEFVDPNWLTHLLKPLHEGYDISSIRTTDPDGWEVDDYISEDDKFGCLWAIKREVYETIGGLDESFGKGYFEDLDYHQRAKEAGFKVGKNHAGLVEHKGKQTFSVVDIEDTAYNEAREKFKKKYGGVW